MRHLTSPCRDDLRRVYRQRRKDLGPNQQQQAAEHLLLQCQQQPEFIHANNIALYLANDGEIDLVALIEYCWQHNKQVYLPVLHPFSHGHLLFVHYHNQTVMNPNRFGILEPKIRCSDICPLAKLDVIFAPLVAFDQQGNRVGMGGGFYDRTLAPVTRDKLHTSVIGAAHDCQLVEAGLTGELWDIPLQKILTPEHVFCCAD